MIREKLGKKFIKINDDVEKTSEETVETKEEENMGFFAKHKKGLIIGGIGALAAGAVGLILSKSKSDDDYDEDYDYDDEVDSDSDESETTEEA